MIISQWTQSFCLIYFYMYRRSFYMLVFHQLFNCYTNKSMRKIPWLYDLVQCVLRRVHGKQCLSHHYLQSRCHTRPFGSFISMAKLCKTAHAIIILHTFSGCILIPWCRQLNLFFHQPNVRSMQHLVFIWALLNFSWHGSVGLRYGVIRKLLHAYPLSPRINPSCTDRWDSSKWVHTCEHLIMWLSCTRPGHLATTFLNLPEKKNLIYTLFKHKKSILLNV